MTVSKDSKRILMGFLGNVSDSVIILLQFTQNRTSGNSFLKA